MDTTTPPNWLASLDELVARHDDAAEAFAVFQVDALQSEPDDEAEEVVEVISNECRQLREDMIVLLARLPDREIADAFLATDGTGPRADALCFVMKRRNVDF